MEKSILEFHGWRWLPSDDHYDPIALFCFSLLPESERQQRKRLEHEDLFWCEARFQRFLAERPGWAKLDRHAKVRALFHYAQEEIRAAHRKLRQVNLFWSPTAPWRDGPHVDLASIRFPDAPPVTIDPEDPATSPRFHAREGAGL